MADEKEQTFKVTDKRKFNADGSLRDATPEPEPVAAAQEQAKVVSFPGGKSEPAPAPSAQPRQSSPHTEAAFLTLINMLAIESEVALGLQEHPARGGFSLDLETARHMIDMLGALEEKTRGNLSAKETKILADLLAYLRMQYVAASKKQ
ncbi:MAG: DUF1844 domain-containing protein [Acidobacteriota bacterium]